MDLRQIGLSGYEEKAYRALIKLGKSGAGRICAESGVSHGRIYEVLASLENKGLVKLIPEKTKKFAASDPENLSKLIKLQEQKLKSLDEEVKTLKQSYASQEKEAVYVVHGKNNFYKIVREVTPGNKTAYAIKYTSEFNPQFVGGVERQIKRGVKPKVLAKYDSETKENVRKWLKIVPNMGKIKNEGVAMNINENEVLITLIKNNTSILIKDKAFAKIAITLFENTYKNSEKIR